MKPFPGWSWVLALGILGTLAIAVFSGHLPRASQATQMHLAPVALPDDRHAPVDCPRPPARKPMVILVLGQSNAANHGQPGAPLPSSAPDRVYAYFAGRCYLAADPMPGASGTGASFMPKLGELLLEKGAAEEVLFVPLAVESTRVTDWLEHPELRDRLRAALSGLAGQGLEVNRVLWQQGEADNNRNTSGEAYRQGLIRFIHELRALGVRAPIHVARTSYCKGRINRDITTAQIQVLDSGLGILTGPDTDALVGEAWRADGCHFTARGLAAVATLWSEVLVQ